jgi:hypothetical protein
MILLGPAGSGKSSFWNRVIVRIFISYHHSQPASCNFIPCFLYLLLRLSPVPEAGPNFCPRFASQGEFLIPDRVFCKFNHFWYTI